MKTTIKSIVIIAVMLLCGSCSKLVSVLPEQITVIGQVTDKDGQPMEGVHVEVNSNSFMSMTFPVGETQNTDENGFYEVTFAPKKGHTFSVTYRINKDDYFYYSHYSVDSWVAVQEHNVVLKKVGE